MQVFVNDAILELAAPMGPADATLTLVSVADLPTGGNISLYIATEIILMTGRAGNVLSVLRGQEGTMATSHAIDDPVVISVTAGALAQFQIDTIVAASRAPRNYVPLNNSNASPGSPYAPRPGDWCFVDLTSGPVEIAPAGLSTSQWFYFKLKPGVTPTGTNALTVTAMAGGQIEQPVFGTFGSSLVFSDPTVMGASLTLVCVGTNLVIE